MALQKNKQIEIMRRMEHLGIKEKDLIEKFVFGSGSGGQKLNKTASCIYLKHLPTGIEVKCQKNRSREVNRFFARRELCEKIASKIYGEKTAKDQKKLTIRKNKQRRLRRLKQKERENTSQLDEDTEERSRELE